LYRRFLKSLIDRIAAAIALIALSPLMAIVAVLVGFRLGRPVLFRQKRIGVFDKPFTFLKFRTMTEEYGADGFLLPDESRLTSLGRFLRSSSLDELPQLWNILRGDMSLIGPRPLLPEYLPRYSPSQRRRHEMKPGITGWAQINGRNNTTWERRLEHDVWYVDHCSFAFDLKILTLTLLTVFKREGISQGGHATMPEFRG
jgi:lipopolysaccharide/colanic/teichoic acid biosynthesis glycosyltransferase